MAITLSSSADIVSFPKPKQRFAATSKSWLSQQLADEPLTHGDKLLASILYLYIDKALGGNRAAFGVPRMGEITGRDNPIQKQPRQRAAKNLSASALSKSSTAGSTRKRGNDAPTSIF